MNTWNSLRGVAAFAAGLGAAFVVSSAALAQEAGPEEAAAMTSALPSGARESLLPRDVLESAGAYRSYMRTAAAISADFSGGESVAKSVKTGARFQAEQVARGAVGYAAIVALHDQAFVQGVRRAGADPEARTALVAQLIKNPFYASTFHGADSAAGSIAAAMSEDGGRVRAAGVRVKQAAYSVQHQAWSKGEVSGRVERLAEAKALSAQPMAVLDADIVRMSDAVRELPARRMDASWGQPQLSSVAARGMALAALAVLGEAESDAAQQMLRDPECASCLRMSKLNLFQCLSVAKPWYEDVFCLGQHVLIDAGDCIYTASGAPKAALAALPAGRPEDEAPTQLAGVTR